MTIARRLTILVALPLIAMLGLAGFIYAQMAATESHSRFVSGSLVPSLALLGNLSRTVENLRVNVRSHLLATNPADQAQAKATFDAAAADVSRLLSKYEESLVSSDRDRRLFDDYRGSSRDYIKGARQVMDLSAEGRRQEGVVLLNGDLAETSHRLARVSSEWIQHNEGLATAAGKRSVEIFSAARWKMLVVSFTAILLTGMLGFLTFSRIVKPIQALERSVKTIAAGDYAKEVPFTNATDETGGLARSIEVLKQGATAMEGQRWVKIHAAKLTGELQGAGSLADFGQRLVSGLVPMLGGGVAGFYLFEEESGHLQRIASYGLDHTSIAANSFRLGEGLVGQCAEERKRLTLDHLPPDYLRIASGLGAALPVQAVASPLLSKEVLLGVLEIATLRSFEAREQALLEEILPVAAMSLEVLQRNLRTRDLLEQVRVTEERTRLILDSTAEGIYGMGTDGGITFVNQATCRMLAFTAEEMIGQSAHPLIHHHRADGSVYPVEECPMRAACERGEARHVNDEFLWRKDGVGFPVEYGTTPIIKDGEILGGVVSFTDITERKQAEQRLRETEQFFRSVLELAPDGLMVVDAAGVIKLANARCEKLFGYTREELIGQSVEKLVPTEVRAHHPKLREAFHDNPTAREMGANRELRGLRKDGTLFPVEIGLSPLPVRHREDAQVAVSVRDITERKEQEDALKQAKAKAEEATQMKSMFLANMSHEIRTPMNAIIGLSHLALRTQLTPKQRDYVSKVHNAGTSLLAIINDILDFSKIEAGKLDLETTDFRIDDVINSVTTLTAQKAHEKGLEFLAHVVPGIPEVLLGDPLRLGQILTNFVNNAVKFTERGEIRLEIEQLERTGEKVQLKFSVRDSGIGMTKEQAAKLFQPFTQADMSTTRKHGGTGLGLTICRRLVELMGGRIWLESEAGIGTTFYFTVWLAVGSATCTGKIIPEKLAQLRVLVVDDNPSAREILQEPLSTVAKRVDTVASGREAIAFIQRHDEKDPYDIVFMDWRMPGMDGLQASRHIKSDETLQHPPHIVLVTAFGREEVREEAERLQLDGFLVKPVTKSMILDTLVNVFAVTGEGLITPAQVKQEARLRDARILLTEDNEINQQIAVELLKDAGATVQVANNGREAVELLSAGPQPTPFDVVLMDLQMPEMDGYQATAKLRSDTRFRALPIVAMTAHATIEERQRCLSAGMNDHISKPIDPEMLFETVGRFCRPLARTLSPSEDKTADENPAERSARDFPVIAGLDTQDGLCRVAGNQKLYLKLLRQFVDQQVQVPEQIASALIRRDSVLAERLAHTLKGVAGNIGARHVHAAAGALEKLIRDRATAEAVEFGRQQVVDALSPLVAQLQVTLNSVAAEPLAPTPAPTMADPAQSRVTAEQLIRLLAEFDPSAADFIQANESRLRSLFAAESWERLQQYAQAYAFEECQTLVEEATRKPSIL